MKKRIIAAVAVFGLLGGILYFAYAQTAAQNNVKHFTAFFAVEGEAIDQNNDMKKEIARLTGADCEEVNIRILFPEIPVFMRQGHYFL